jgi:phosphoserine phosphatase
MLYGRCANIERIKMTAHGDLNVMEILVDLSDTTVDFDRFKYEMERVCKSVGQDVVLQKEDVFEMPKRLIVFDVDGTLIDAEIIDRLAAAAGAGVHKEVRKITAAAMEGKIDFAKALKARARLLKGLSVETLEKIAEQLEISPSAEELIRALKRLGYKIALISGGFTFFTDKIKERLGIDYVFANKLVVKSGKLTGEVAEPVIDEWRKGEIIRELTAREKLKAEEIVAVGDGANDRFMLENSGLAIALNTRTVLQDVADGVMSKENLAGLLYCLGTPERKLRSLKTSKDLVV